MKKRNRSSTALLAIATTLLLCSLVVSCSPSDPSNDPPDTEDLTSADEHMTNTTAETDAAESSAENSTTQDETTGSENAEVGTAVEEDTEEKETLEEETLATPDSVIAAVSPAHGETICVANAQVAEYASKYTIGSSANYHGSGDIYMPLPLTLTWEDVGADCYRVRVATTEDFSNSQVVLTADTTVSFTNPLVATKYYWQVEALYEDKTDASAIFVFKTANTPRTVYIDGVTNTRDIGGYAVSETSRIRVGMVYRAAYLHGITQEGLYHAREELGIKCELDIRTPGEGGAGVSSSLGEDILYYNYDGAFYSGIKSSERQKNLANEIKVFADPNNYPLIFHCSLGRDRTGTLSMIILALCGVSEEDIYMDYELSFFCELCCNEPTELHVNGNIAPTIAYLKTFGRTNDSLQTCVENFCLRIGVTQEEIDSIRSILIEEVK